MTNTFTSLPPAQDPIAQSGPALGDFFASLEGKSNHQLRGDYALASLDFGCEQAYENYTETDQKTWRYLFAEQSRLCKSTACNSFLSSLELLESDLNLSAGIPRFEQANELLMQATGWQIIAVPGLIPDEAFFNHLAQRRFPVTRWIRGEAELNYIVEPDLFHDFFGHVPMLLDPAIADFLQRYGVAACNASALKRTQLAALYWYAIEYGLVKEDETIKALGAGLLSSSTELTHAITATHKHQSMNEVIAMNCAFQIDRFQDRYFVMTSLRSIASVLD